MPEINAPLQFLEALDSLRGHTFRPEIHVVQIPPPKAIAPWAVALQAEINDSPFLDPDTYRGDARFVLLHDPQGQPAWEGQFRVVSYASSTLDPDIADDPILPRFWQDPSVTVEEKTFISLPVLAPAKANGRQHQCNRTPLRNTSTAHRLLSTCKRGLA